MNLPGLLASAPRFPAPGRWRILAALLAAGAALSLNLGAFAEEPARKDAPPGEAAAPVPAGTPPAGGPPPPPGPAAQPAPGPQPASSPQQVADDVQLSFQGANIDAVMKWLAEVTGKSIAKHKGVQCQLTILSPKKLPVREAILLVYRALALEGFSAVETRNAILIVPEADVLKASAAELVEAADGPVEGKQILVRVFKLEHTQVERLKDKVKVVLSDKGKLDTDERANKLIVTDYADNVQLLGELIRELDVEAAIDQETEVVPLKYAQAEDLANILNAVLGDAKGAPGAPPGGDKPPPPAGSKPGTVRILPDKGGNRLIVTAPPERMPQVKELIATLDTQKPADVAVRVLALRHVVAKDLVQEIGPMYQKLQGTSIKDLVEIAANSRSNSLIILSSLVNYSAIKDLVTSLDTEEAQEKAMKAMPLKYADAEDVATQLTDLHEAREDDYGYYYYRRSRGSSGAGGVRFVADRRRNAVIVIAPPGALDRIVEMIRVLDEPVQGENLVPKIYPLKFVSAVDVEQVLNQLFLRKTQQRSYWYYDDYESEVEDRDIGRLYGKVRIASEPYTNSLIVTSNSTESQTAVEAILKQLDVPSQEGGSTLYLQLKYANAITIANNINILFAQQGAPARGQRQQQPRQGDGGTQQQQQGLGYTQSTGFELEDEVVEESYYPWLGGGGGGQQDPFSRFGSSRTTPPRPVSDLVGKVRVVADIRTNSLMVTSNIHFFPQVMKVVDDLDIPTPQVLLEAKIIAVGRDGRERLGARWSPDGSQVFDREDFDDSIIAETNTSFREVFAGSALPGAMRTGVFDVNVNLDYLIQFLVKNFQTRVRAEPRLHVADNERGKLFVGSRVPFISNSQTTPEGTRNDAFQYIDVGIILEVTPHINNRNEVALRVRVESSQIRQGETLFGGAIIDTRNYKTELSVRNGQTLVLGGIIETEQSEVERKVPLLGDIPFLGWFFKKRDTVNREVELMVFLRPTITQSPEEVKALMEAERAKTPQIQRWEEDLDRQRREEEAAEAEERAERAAEEAREKPDGAPDGEK